ncbi:hypothetical protein GCM10010911_48070 [Paenibacillus nasutitermitis]|uniref:Uncharacterized protein n=1 Tax=Paenibacillus nasutitermitis TaxID=1652958 RepID=A0A916ZAF3_9BACL|nr:hypothetical protein GCM10010911_48070 [Paenibacillus nasutitermitis]
MAALRFVIELYCPVRSLSNPTTIFSPMLVGNHSANALVIPHWMACHVGIASE